MRISGLSPQPRATGFHNPPKQKLLQWRWCGLVILTELGILQLWQAVLYITRDGSRWSHTAVTHGISSIKHCHLSFYLATLFIFFKKLFKWNISGPCSLKRACFWDMCWRFISGFESALDLTTFNSGITEQITNSRKIKFQESKLVSCRYQRVVDWASMWYICLLVLHISKLFVVWGVKNGVFIDLKNYSPPQLLLWEPKAVHRNILIFHLLF